MKKASHTILFVALFFFLLPGVYAQSDQSWNNGQTTTPVNFAGSCTYTWTNDNPSIGLPPSGTGPIPAFTAVNTGANPVVAHITATPIMPSNFAYITNYGSNNVSVINLSNHTVVTKIDVGKNPYGVAVSPDGNFVYIGNAGSNNVSVISTATNKVITTVDVQLNPLGLCVSPDGKILYVANDGSSSISVIDISKYKVINTFPIVRNPYGIAISTDGSELFVAGEGSASVSVFSTATYGLLTTIPVGYNPWGIIVSPDGNYVYVANASSANVTVVNTKTNQTVTNIQSSMFFEATLTCLAISPDGGSLYVSNDYSNSIYVIDTKTNIVTKQINLTSQTSPMGMSLNADGSELYVSNEGSNSVSVINTFSNAVIKTITVDSEPYSFGNFVKTGTGCAAVSFTITVNPPPPPTITTTTPTGTISACKGTASASPDIEQFNASGTNLTGDITVTAPSGFEVSRNSDQGYSSSLILTQSLGVVTSSLIFVRSAATAPVGNNVMGNVTLSSPGATDQPVAVTATVYGIPIADVPTPQIKVNGAMTDPVFFKGSASSYTWVNNTTGVGLAASGTGDIPSFTAINNTSSPIIALITVTPVNGADCDGSPDEFTITVEPTPTVLGVAGTLAPLTTVYGTASPAESFAVSSNTVNSKILVIPPAGFEVSSDGTNFNPTITVTSTESNAPVIVYIRLESTDHVGAYGPGDVTISNPNAEKNASITMPEGSVTRAPLTITADNKTKAVGANNPALTASYSGFVNKDGPAQLTALPGLSTIATATSAVGKYAIDISGADSPDYNINYNMGVLTIVPSLNSSSIPNTFTPNGDGKNDTWVVTDLQYYPKATVNIFNRFGQKLYTSVGYSIPWDGKYKGKVLPSGTYYYIIDPKNGEPVLAGWVAIIR